MSAPTTEPVPPAGPTGAEQADPPAASARRGPTGLLHATAIVAAVGVAVAVIGLVLTLRPVTTPTQDCGTALAFVLTGRVNEFVALDDLPKGVTEQEAEANNEEPCRVRVADQIEPGAVLLAAGLAAALLAAFIEVFVRSLRWHQRRRRCRARHAPT